MAEENRTPDKKIGGNHPCRAAGGPDNGPQASTHGPGAPEKEAVKAHPDHDPSKKKTGEF